MLLQIEKIDSYYENSHVLHGVSLEVDKGEMIAILGRNGVGKSTTLKSIMGLVHPRSGVIRFKDEVISGKKPNVIAHKGIGYVPEERRIFPHLTVRENLIMGQKTGKHGRRFWVDDRKSLRKIPPVGRERRYTGRQYLRWRAADADARQDASRQPGIDSHR